MKPPKWTPENDEAFNNWKKEHSEWHDNYDLAELIGYEQIIGFQIVNIGRTTVFRLMFSNGGMVRIHGFKDLRDPDIIKLSAEFYISPKDKDETG